MHSRTISLLSEKIFISFTLPSFLILLLSFYHFFHACLFYFLGVKLFAYCTSWLETVVSLATWHGTIRCGNNLPTHMIYQATPFYCTTYQFSPLSSSMFYVIIILQFQLQCCSVGICVCAWVAYIISLTVKSFIYCRETIMNKWFVYCLYLSSTCGGPH